MNVALVDVVVSVPATAAPPLGASVIDTDDGAKDPPNVTPIVEFTATPVAFVAGVVDATFTVVPVVNNDVKGVIAVPPGLDAFTVTVYVTELVSATVGVNVALVGVVVRLPATAPLGPLTTMDTVEALNEPEKFAVTAVAVDTCVAPLAGETDVTAGAVSAGGVGVYTTSTK